MSEKKVIITGATGMVGGCALRFCLDNPDVSLVTAIGRNSTGIDEAKLNEIIVDEFTDYSSLAGVLKNQDVALFCLGTYTGAVPDDIFHRITVDYPLVRRIYPNVGISSEDLAAAMVHAGLYGTGENENQINDKKENKTMSKKIRALIVSGIACLVYIGAGFLFTPSIAETVQPLADPQLNKGPLKEVMIFGASGTVGDGILKALIMDKNVQKVQVITRRLTPRIEEGVKLGKVVVTKHMNYLDYAPIKDKLSNVKAVYWAIGTSARNVSDEKYTEIHVDFPVAFVKLWLSLVKGNQSSFHLITGAGTGEDSWFHWAREKAKAEIELTALAKGSGLRFIAYRPSFVAPSAERITFFKKLFYGPMEFMTFAVRSTHIGQCMIEVTMRDKEIGSGGILDHSSIRDFAEVYRERNDLSN